MKLFRFFVSLLGAIAALSSSWALAGDTPPAASAPAPAQSVEDGPEVERAPASPPKKREQSSKRGHNGRDITKWGGEAVLPEGEEADNLVALFGPVSADGKVKGNAVAIFGPVSLGAMATGQGNVVAVVGDARVDGLVEGNVVSVLGRVELGPKARVEGNVVSVGSRIHADPAAVVEGNIVEAGRFEGMPELKGLQAWVQHAFLLGRPLALHRDVLWAWGVAGLFLALYLFIALVMNGALVKCSETLEQRPGKTVLAAFLTVLLTPLLFIVLSITVVGAPLLALAIAVVSLIGKAAFLCWFGRRVTLALGLRHALPAVFIGGVLLMLLYVLPFLGFLMMKTTDAIGVGMVVYTLMLSGRREKPVTASRASDGKDGNNGGGGNVFVSPVPPPPPISPAGAMPAGASSAFTPGVGEPVGAQSPFVAFPPMSQGQAQTQTGGEGPKPEMRMPQIPITSAMPRAGFGVRLGALLIDFILMMAAVVMTRLDDLGILFLAAYFIVLWALKGTTVGGVICGLKIVRLDDRPLDWTTALVRGLAGFVSVLPAGLGFLWIVFDDEKQAWHDKVAGTVVVYAPKGMSLV